MAINSSRRVSVTLMDEPERYQARDEGRARDTHELTYRAIGFAARCHPPSLFLMYAVGSLLIFILNKKSRLWLESQEPTETAWEWRNLGN